jgi:hypothetical protein
LGKGSIWGDFGGLRDGNGTLNGNGMKEDGMEWWVTQFEKCILEWENRRCAENK